MWPQMISIPKLWNYIKNKLVFIGNLKFKKLLIIWFQKNNLKINLNFLFLNKKINDIKYIINEYSNFPFRN